MVKFALRAKLALWANVLAYGAGIADNLRQYPPRRAIIRWYWANLTMAMGAIFALNAAALYVLHSGRAEKAPLVATIALATTLVWLVLDSGEGLINSIEDGEPTPSFLTTLLTATFLRPAVAMILPAPAARAGKWKSVRECDGCVRLPGG